MAALPGTLTGFFPGEKRVFVLLLFCDKIPIVMEQLIGNSVWLGALFIFLARVVNMALDTLRVFMVVRNRRAIAWVMGFAQTLIFVLVFTYVIQDLDNVLNLIAYAGGYATGNVVGMWIEARMAVGHSNIRIMSPSRGSALAERLREEGFAVTELSGRGKDGMVSVLLLSVTRRSINHVQQIAQEVDENAFITAEELRPMQRGFWGR